MRLLLWAMALVGAFAVARVLLTAADDREEWMRWAPSVDLAGLAEGAEARLDWNGRPWRVRALTPDEVTAVHDLDERTLAEPAPLDTRLLRVEIDGRTRYYAALTADPPPAGCDRYDAVGRSRCRGFANRQMPAFVVADRTLYLHPDQPVP